MPDALGSNALTLCSAPGQERPPHDCTAPPRPPSPQALIDHGDMSQVLIQELPAGRSPVVTRAIEDKGAQRAQVRRRRCGLGFLVGAPALRPGQEPPVPAGCGGVPHAM